MLLSGGKESFFKKFTAREMCLNNSTFACRHILIYILRYTKMRLVQGGHMSEIKKQVINYKKKIRNWLLIKLSKKWIKLI